MSDFRSAAGATSSSTTTSVTVSVPAGLANEDYWYIGVVNGGADAAPSTVPTDFVLVDSQGTTATGTEAPWWAGVYRKPISNAAGETAVTFSGFTNSCTGAGIAVSGAAASSPENVTGSRLNIDPDVGATSVTTTVDGCLLVLVVAVPDNTAMSAQSFATAGAATERVEQLSTGGDDTGISISTVEQTTAGATGDATFTLAGSRDNACFILAVRPPSGGGGSITPSGQVTPTGAVTRATSKVVAGTVTPSGAVTRRPARTLAGVTTPAGALTRVVIPVRGGQIAPAGALARSVLAVRSGQTTPTGQLTRLVARAVAGAVTPTGSASQLRAAIVALGGAVTPSGTPRRVTSRTLAGSVTPAGALLRVTARAVAGAVTPAGVLANVRAALLAVSGATTPAGTLARQTARTLTGQVAPPGSVRRLTARAVGGSTTPAGVIGRVPARLVAGAITPSGAVARTRLAVLAVAGTVGTSGTVRRLLQRAFSAAAAPSGTVVTEGGVSPPPVAPQGSWQGLLAILRGDPRPDVFAETTCPHDGELYRLDARGDRVCPFDGYRPDDRAPRPVNSGRDWGGLRAATTDRRRRYDDEDRGWGS